MTPRPTPHRLGRQAEALASRFLASQGYRILERYVRFRFGEIDLVAQEGRTICLVEIRSRSSVRSGWPEESITHEKRRRLIRLAQGYLKFRRLKNIPVRFDVVSILFGPDGTPSHTRLIRGAFEAS